MSTAVRPPGPAGKPIVGSLLDFRRDMTGFVQRLARRYGDVAAFRLGPHLVFLVSHPELVEEVLLTGHRSFVKSRGLERMKPLLGEGLLTSEGAFHLRQRRMVQPAFHQPRIAEYGETMACYADRHQAAWEEGATVDMAEEMRALTLRIAGKTLFDAELEEDRLEIAEAFNAILELYPRILLPFAELLERLPIPSTRRFERERERLDRIVYRLIRERRAAGGDPGDVLSMLLQAVDEEEEGAPGNGGGRGAGDTRGASDGRAAGGGRAGAERGRSPGDGRVPAGRRMTDRQVRDEVLTLLLAGHETTANALAWTFYLLSENPEAEAALHREVDAALGGRAPTAADVPELRVARNTLAEAMRLYPPSWMIGRRALEDYEVGDHVLPAGGMAFLSQWVVHRDPRWWPDPLRFLPSRWEEPARDRPRFSYFPFGGGPRLCIGEGFAWTEGVLVLATVARRWRPRLVPGHPVELLPRVTLRPKHGIRMVLERRR